MVFQWLTLALVGAAPQSPAVVRFPVQAPPDLPQDVRDALEAAADSGLTEAGYEPVAAADACADAECVRSSAGEHRAIAAVRVRVTSEASDYVIAVWVLDAEGETVGQDTQTCEICRHDEVAARLSTMVATVGVEARGTLEPRVEQPTFPPVTTRLSVVSRPPGARVVLDGRDVGRTPYEGTLRAGGHSLRVHKPGYRSVERALDARGEALDEGVELELERRVSPRTEVAIGWAALGVGLAAAASGAILLGLDENPIKRDCSGANVDHQGVCKYRYNTLIGGILFVVAGVASVGTGLGLVVHGRKAAGTQRRAGLGHGGLALRF